MGKLGRVKQGVLTVAVAVLAAGVSLALRGLLDPLLGIRLPYAPTSATVAVVVYFWG